MLQQIALILSIHRIRPCTPFFSQSLPPFVKTGIGIPPLLTVTTGITMRISIPIAIPTAISITSTMAAIIYPFSRQISGKIPSNPWISTFQSSSASKYHREHRHRLRRLQPQGQTFFVCTCCLN